MSLSKVKVAGFIFFISATAAGIAASLSFSPWLRAPGYFIAAFGISGLVIFSGGGKALPLPLSIKKWILFRAALPVVSLIGQDEAVSYFSDINNSLNPVKPEKVLLLLPSCIQKSGCGKDLVADINNCARCGECQVSWMLGNIPEKFSLYLVKGGRAAIDKIKEIRPDAVLAVACEKELKEGIGNSLSIPVWAVRNLRPDGPCRNTVVSEEEFLKILKML